MGQHTIWYACCTRSLPYVPVSTTVFVCMHAEVQPGYFSFHHLLDLDLWDTPKPGKHCQEFTASQTLNQGIKLYGQITGDKGTINYWFVYTPRSIRRPGTYVRISQKPLEIFLPSASIPQLCESAKWSLVHTPSSSSLVRSQTFHMLLPCGYITISYWFSWTRDWDSTPRTVRSELPGYQIIIKFIHV